LPSTQHVLESVRSFSEKAAAFVEPRKELVTRTLSGGQRQLLAIITAILGGPSILLLDEHQASLDEELKSISDELTRSFVSGRVAAAIVATHNREWVKRQCNTVFSFNGGTLNVQPTAQEGYSP